MSLDPTSSVDLIKAAATSNRALAAYGFMLVAWVIIAFRVRRNKNVLRHLKDLPEKDRLESIRLEMDARPKDTSPEQWIESRIYRYYFLGFLFLVAVIAFVIWLFVQAKKTSVAEVIGPTIVAYTQTIEEKHKAQSLISEMGKLNKLRIGESPEFVLSLFGEPSEREDYTDFEESPGQYKEFSKFNYKLDHYFLEVFFYTRKAHSFTVILTDPTQSVTVNELGDKAFGKASFSSFETGESLYSSPIIDKSPSVWGYVETFWPQDPNGGYIVSVAYSALGASYRDYGSLTKNPLLAFLVSCSTNTANDYCREIDDDDALVMNDEWNKEVEAGYDNLYHSEELAYFRHEVFPNAYHVEARYGFMMKDSSPPDVPVFSAMTSDDEGKLTFAGMLWDKAGRSETPCNPKCPIMGD